MKVERTDEGFLITLDNKSLLSMIKKRLKLDIPKDARVFVDHKGNELDVGNDVGELQLKWRK